MGRGGCLRLLAGEEPAHHPDRVVAATGALLPLPGMALGRLSMEAAIFTPISQGRRASVHPGLIPLVLGRLNLVADGGPAD